MVSTQITELSEDEMGMAGDPTGAVPWREKPPEITGNDETSWHIYMFICIYIYICINVKVTIS
jgi:hypothetical protein